MLYVNTDTGAFGLSIGALRLACPNVSIPDDPSDLPDGFAAYQESTPPSLAWDEAVQEAAPAGGLQQWAVETLTGDALVAATASLKASKLAEVQARQAQALAAMPYTVGGVTYTVTIGVTDRVDLQEQLQLLQGAPAGTQIPWEIVTGVYLQWGVSDLQALQAAGVQYIPAVYANASALTAQINSAADGAALAAIDPTQGWPG